MPYTLSGGRPLRAILASCLCLLLPFAGGAGGDETEQAIASERATQALLLDVTRAGERLVAVGEYGHVILSDDGGKSWRQAQSVPTRTTLTGVSFVDARQGWAVGHDLVVIHTSDGGEVWELQYSEPEEEIPFLSVHFENSEHGLAVGAFSLVMETDDGGGSWRRRPLQEGSEDDFHLNDIFAGPEESLFIAAEFGAVYRSRDHGQTWKTLEPGYTGSFWSGLGLSDGAILVFGMRGHLFRSEDLGESWQQLETGTEQSLGGGVELAKGGVVLVGLGGAVLRSADGGRSFDGSTRPNRRALATAIDGAPGRLVLFGETGIEILEN